MSKKMNIFIFITAALLSSCDNNNVENEINSAALVTDVPKLGQNENDSFGVVNVGRGEISLGVLRYYLAQKGFSSRNKKINKEELDLVLDDLVSLELYKQAAIKNKLDKDPATVLAMARVLSNKYQVDVLVKNSNLIQVSSEEVKAHFEKNKKKYMTPARRRGAIISVRLSNKSSVSERKSAQEKLKTAAKLAVSFNEQQKFFSDLASRYSDDVVSKSRRGDIGWVVEGGNINRYEPAVIKALFSLSDAGDVSSVVKGERGYYLIKLVDLKPAVQQTLKQVERTIHNKLLLEKRHAAELQITKKLKSQFKVSINDSVINDFMKNINTKNIDTNNMPPSFPVAVKTK